MKGLINIGLMVTGFLFAIKIFGMVSLIVGGHPYTNLFLLKQALLAVGNGSVFAWLLNKQKQDRQRRFDTKQARRASRNTDHEGDWPPPPKS